MSPSDRIWRERGLRSAVLAGDERAWQILYEESFVALADLPANYEAVLRGKYLDDLRVDEIAAAWHTTPKAIESLLTRARQAFRDAFRVTEQDTKDKNDTK